MNLENIENIKNIIDNIPENFEYVINDDFEHNEKLNNIFMSFKSLAKMDVKYFNEYKDHPFWLNYKTNKKSINILYFLLLEETNIEVCEEILKLFQNNNKNFNFVVNKNLLFDNKYFERNFNFLLKHNLLILEENHINKDLLINLIYSNHFCFFEKFLENDLYNNLYNDLSKEKMKKYLPVLLNSKKSKENIFYIGKSSNNIKYFAYKYLYNSNFLNNIETIIKLENDLLNDNCYKKDIYSSEYFNSILKNILYFKKQKNYYKFEKYINFNIMYNYNDKFTDKLSSSLTIYQADEIKNTIQKRKILKELSDEINNKETENKIFNKRKM